METVKLTLDTGKFQIISLELEGYHEIHRMLQRGEEIKLNATIECIQKYNGILGKVVKAQILNNPKFMV